MATRDGFTCKGAYEFGSACGPVLRELADRARCHEIADKAKARTLCPCGRLSSLSCSGGCTAALEAAIARKPAALYAEFSSAKLPDTLERIAVALERLVDCKLGIRPL
jgi:hypothetical protein